LQPPLPRKHYLHGLYYSGFMAVVLMFCFATAIGQSVVSKCVEENFSSNLDLCDSAPGSSGHFNEHLGPEESRNLDLSFPPSLDAPANISSSVAGNPASEPAHEGFHWRRALEESATLLVFEQAYVIHTDFRWVVGENGIPFNHYWRDYMQSLSAWTKAGWNDGDPNMYGYLGHPIQGALTSFIEIQNDPKSRNLEFSNTKKYWRSRLKATIWNAVYSTQWNLGPISEVTVEKYGAKFRSPWNQNGTWPCTTKNCFTGVGQIDIVMTPIGGFGWMVGEDWLDKNISRRVEHATRNRFLIDTVRTTFNPVRAGANLLHGNAPWFRPRDVGNWDGHEMLR
jgi:hypothetical protein